MKVEAITKTATNKDETKKNHGDDQDEVDYDDLLSSAGEIGIYQILLFFSTFPFYLYGVCVYLSQLFITEASPNHWCWIPELENLTDIERRTLAIPSDAKNVYGYSRCSAYVANWSEVLSTGIRPNDSWSTVACQNGWEFNKSEIPYPTITSDMGWVCEKDSYQATAQAFYFLGSTIGCFPIGWIADRYGRVPAAVLSNVIACVGGVASVFVRNFHEFVICRFIMGLAGERCMLIIYLLVLEYVAPKYRTLISNMSLALFFSLSAISIPWISLACGHWKTFALVTSVPMALVLIAPFVIPESPKWLLSKGRIDDAVMKVVAIGRVNKKHVSKDLINRFKLSESKKEPEESKNLIELLKAPVLRKMVICMCIVYMCCTLVFDALVRSIGSLKYDFFVSFSIMVSTELPSLIILTLILDHLGRRWSATISLIMSCVFCILSVLVGSGLPTVICVIIARFFANIAYATSELWSPEMMPTSVRASASGFVNICGYGSMIFAPYIVYLQNYVHWLPLVLVGCVAGIGAIVTLALPETANKKMPQHFEDSEELVRSDKFWSIPYFTRRTLNKSAKYNSK